MTKMTAAHLADVLQSAAQAKWTADYYANQGRKMANKKPPAKEADDWLGAGIIWEATSARLSEVAAHLATQIEGADDAG